MKSGVYKTPVFDTGIALVSREDVANMAAACLLSEKHVGQTYFPTGPEVVTAQVIADAASRLKGHRVRAEPVSFEAQAAIYQSRGYDDARIQLSLLLDRIAASGALAQTSEDVLKVTGAPPTSMFEVCRNSISPS